jgi:superfamily II DNA or RNA helicase
VTTAPSLRSYQTQGVAQIRDHFANGVRRVCYQAPTGSGKTVLFCYVLEAAFAKGTQVLVLAHRQEIIDQIDRALVAMGIPHGIIAAGYPAADEAVQIASVATLVRRLDRVGNYGLVIVDECHHAVAGTWRQILSALSTARVLGVSATPERLDGKGLNDIFEVLVPGPTVKELINIGYLAPFAAYGPKLDLNLDSVAVSAGDYRVDQLAQIMARTVVTKSAVSEYRRICPGAPTIVFCVDIEHSRLVTDAFNADGWRAAHVDGNTPTHDRRMLMQSLADGSLQVLSNCGLISEGLDISGVVAAILLRPTMSLSLYLQQVGRALRPGKPRAFILDHAGNIERHGLPDFPHNWSLEGRPKGSSYGAPVRRCEACGASNPISAKHCHAAHRSMSRRRSGS